MKRTRRHWVLLAGSAAAIGCGVALGQTALTEAIDSTLPDARGIASFNRPGTITLLSSDGQVIQKLGPATREKLNPGEMPELVKQAFVAAEDRRFYEHDGVDLWGISRALFTNIKQRSVREGASTITQQLARTVFLSQDRTITRKLREAALAYKLERQLSKEQILEQYLNYVYLGSGAYGVADAAWVYYSKTPDQLTLPEAALIAGLPPAPSVYSPLVDEDVATERRSIVLERMQQAGFITASEAEQAASHPPERIPEALQLEDQLVQLAVPPAVLLRGEAGAAVRDLDADTLRTFEWRNIAFLAVLVLLLTTFLGVWYMFLEKERSAIDRVAVVHLDGDSVAVAPTITSDGLAVGGRF